MSLLFSVLFAHKCKNTHHKLALDALRFLDIPEAERWRDLFLTRIDPYLDGSKAPDDKFKDFRNHVLHVSDNEWGGAITTAQTWYGKTVEAFQKKDWSTGVYSAGVLSHYVTDPFQPFHTGQSEAETIVHRAAEWTIACSYDQLRELLDQELGGVPARGVPASSDWLAEIIRQGARLAHKSYEPAIAHYSLKLGAKKPVEGYDETGRRIIAQILGETIRGYALVLGETLKASAVTPPSSPVTIYGVLASLTVPVFAVTKKMSNAAERAAVLAIAKEVEATGRVEKNLSADERAVREAYAAEVKQVSVEALKAEPVDLAGSRHTPSPPTKAAAPPAPPKAAPAEPSIHQTPVAPKKPAVAEQPVAEKPVVAEKPAIPVKPVAAPVKVETPLPSEPIEKKPLAAASVHPVDQPSERSNEKPAPESASPYYLNEGMPLEKAPSIGPKTAERFIAINIRTVGEFLAAEPNEMAKKLAQKHLDAVTLYEWQCQATLCCEIPKFRGYMAQILTAIGIQTREELLGADIDDLWDQTEQFLTTPEAERLMRGTPLPTQDDVRHWQDRAATPPPSAQSATRAA